VEDGTIPAVHGVVRWRLIDLARWLFEESRLEISKQTLSRELRNMGFRKLSARPRHHAQDEEAAAAFKTYGPPRLQVILRSGLVSLRQRIRSQDYRPGQDGDPRVPVLIKLSASRRHFLNQDSRTPVDCQAISLPLPANIVGLSRFVNASPITSCKRRHIGIERLFTPRPRRCGRACWPTRRQRRSYVPSPEARATILRAVSRSWKASGEQP
jgi:hypothetical protein